MTFIEWLEEEEGFGFRIERLNEDFKDISNPITLISWLNAAYEVGLEEGKKNANTNHLTGGPDESGFTYYT